MIDDILFWVIGLFGIVLFLGIWYVGYGEINVIAQNSTLVPDDAKGVIQGQYDNLPNQMDYLVLILYISFVLALLLVTWFLDTHPLMFVIFICVIFIVALIGGYLANIFYDVSESGILSSTYQQMPITTHIITNYVLYTVLAVLLVTVFYFAKPQGGGY